MKTEQDWREITAKRAMDQIIEAYEAARRERMPTDRAQLADALWKKVCWEIAEQYKLNCRGFREKVREAIIDAIAGME